MEKGTIVSVNISAKKGEKKTAVPEVMITSAGLDGDAHSGDWHRQVSLLAQESIDKMRQQFEWIRPGDFAENLTTRGIALPTLKVGTRLRVGDAVLEVTQIGKECHLGCEIREKVGDCIMPREGIFAKVLEPGRVAVGDGIEIL